MKNWILLADDDEDFREMVRMCLESSFKDIQIIEAKDGLEAFSHISSKRFSCIITDMNMPRKNGRELVEFTRKSRINGNTPVILSSGRTDHEWTRAFAHVRILQKPFRSPDLCSTVQAEMELGRTDRRMAIDLVAPFTEELINYYRKNGGDTVTTGRPSIKPRGASLSGDVHCQINLRIGASATHFCISFDANFLKWLREGAYALRTAQVGRLTGEVLATLACQEIFDLVSERLSKDINSSVRLTGLLAVAETDASQVAWLNAGRAVQVKIQTDQGVVCASAHEKLAPAEAA